MRFIRRRATTPSGTAGTEASSDRGGSRNRAVSVRTLMVLVASCGAVLWAARTVREWVDPVNRWTREVRGGPLEQRWDAALKLGDAKGSDVATALPALTVALGDQDERVAAVAAVSLGRAARSVKRGRASALAREAVATLASALKDGRPLVRAAAAGELADTDPGLFGAGAPAAYNAVMNTVLRDPSEQVRWEGASALGRLHWPAPGPPPEALTAALNGDPSRRVRVAAIQALGRFQSGRDQTTLALLQALETDDPEVRRICDGALQRLFESRADAERRSAALVPALLEAVASPDPAVCSNAAAVLGEIGAAAVAGVPALIGLLADPANPKWLTWIHVSPEWRDPAARAALALGEIAPATPRADEAVAALLAVLRSGTSEWRRTKAAEGLARFGAAREESIRPVLVEVLNERMKKSGSLGPSVCLALGRVAPGTPGADEAVGALVAALDAHWPTTRSEAVSALARFGSKARSALPRLRALGKSDPWVQKTAATAVLQIEDALRKEAAQE